MRSRLAEACSILVVLSASSEERTLQRSGRGIRVAGTPPSSRGSRRHSLVAAWWNEGGQLRSPHPGLSDDIPTSLQLGTALEDPLRCSIISSIVSDEGPSEA